MARLVSILGALSGKMGGLVFSHNKSGPYVRNWAMPTNPNTLAQIAARTTFISAVTAWHSLTDPQKSDWNSFALSGQFNPHLPSPPGITTYSGFNAFVSLRNTSLNAARLTRVTAFTTPPATGTFQSFAASLTAPISAFGSSIETNAGGALTQQLTAGQLGVNGNVSITIKFPSSQATTPKWIEPVSLLPSGYLVYASNEVSQAQQFIQNPLLQMVGAFIPPATVTGWTASQSAVFSMSTADFPITTRKLWYSVGDHVRLTVFAASPAGQTQLIGSIMQVVN